MKKHLFFGATVCLMMACGTPATPDTTADANATADVEFTGDENVEMGKASLASMTAGNMDAWIEQFADSAMYRWNNGDSLAGKQAIADYWKNRRSKDITAISFSNDIWLSLKVNKPQNDFVQPGQWLMSWYMVDATYTSGKSMTQWIHSTMHFDDAGKIDLMIQYLDRAPIMEAMKSP